MKYVAFQELKIKNFLSVGEEYVVVKFTKGLHIITGINRDKEDRRNGVGKSTIADALYFAIFGTTLRDIKKDFISNNLTEGICEVQLSFNVNSTRGNDDFTIVRTLNPSKLHIFKNGIDKTRDSIANTTEYIEAVLSSSPEVFQNCVIMTLNNTLPFMAKSKIDKRKFIEQVFNLQIFSEMLSKLREEHNEVKRSNDIEATKHNEVTSSIQMYERQKETKIKDQANQVTLINNKISNYELEVQKLSKEIEVNQNIDTTGKVQEIETVEKIKVVDAQKVFVKTKTTEQDSFLLIKIDVDYNYIREYKDLSDFEIQLQWATKQIIGNNVRVTINNQNNTRKEFNW